MPGISNVRSHLLAAVLAAHGVLPPVASRAADSPPRAPLHDALSRGEPGWASLLAGGAEVNARDDAGNTPLHLAALRGNAEAVDALLARGADAKAVNQAGATPLHYGTGDARIVRALLAHGADPNASSNIRMTPLHGAVNRGDSYAVARLLVGAGADVNAVRGGDGDAVITTAVFGGDPRTVRYLLGRGARPATSTGVGFTTLEMAALMGDEDGVRTLLARGADVNTPSGFVGHALNAALYAGNTRIAALLIERGADLRTRSQFGHGTPPMVWSAYNELGDTTIARLLVSHGADVNEANDAGETALSFALKRGADTPLVRYLRSVGAREPTAPSRSKSPPTREVPTSDDARMALVRERAQQSLDLLARTSRAFLENPFVRNEAKCISCHQQNLPAVAFGLARERGLRVDETELGRLFQAQLGMWAPKAERARQMRPPVPDPPISIGFGLDALAALGYAPDGVTDAFVHYLLGAQ